MSVSVVRPIKRCFTDRVAASGVFAADHVEEVRPDRDGLVVSEVLVEPGDTVTKDQVLAQLVASRAPAQVIAVKAPVGGLVLAVGAVVGAYTSPGSDDPLFRIAEGGTVVLKAETLAKTLPRVRRGMPARIHVLGLGDLDGRVVSIGEDVDAQTQLGTVYLSVAADPRLRIGGFARAEVDTGQDCGLALPSSAMLFGSDGAVVATVRSDRVMMRRVTTGLIDGGDVEIRDGLNESDPVVAKAAPFLRDGDHVRPVPATN